MQMYPHTFSGKPAVQVKEEFEAFLTLLQSEGVSSYLEIGAAYGDTFHEVMMHLPEGSRGVVVDKPNNGWGFFGSDSLLMKAVKDLGKMGVYDITIILHDSKTPSAIEPCLERAPFDCVFIDGDHTLAGVTADWENYGKMARIVAFHDIADPMKPNKKGEKIEVALLWNELKKQYKHVEFIAKDSTMGIGVLWRE